MQRLRQILIEVRGKGRSNHRTDPMFWPALSPALLNMMCAKSSPNSTPWVASANPSRLGWRPQRRNRPMLHRLLQVRRARHVGRWLPASPANR